MAVAVVMPHLGESVVEGTVLEWLKHEGDAVRKDEPLLAISTEKVDAEVPAPAEGVLARILVRPGEAVPVGSTLAEIEEQSSAAAAPRAESRAPREEQPSAVSLQPSAVNEQQANGRGGDLSIPHSATQVRLVPGNPQSGLSPSPPRPGASAPRRFYSPAVLRLAQEFEVDLERVQGTGEGGRVSKRDVEHYLEARARGAAPQAVVEEESGEERVPLTKIRRAIAERMVRSVQTAPHATAVAEVDFTAIARFRSERQAAFVHATGAKLTFLPFVVKAVAHTLREFPMLNARWSEEAIYVQRAIHLGIAVALGEELAVPVLRAPGRLPVSEIAVRVDELIRRAREGRLQPGEVAGSTFTVNNFGSDGSLIGTPILNPPEVGILGVGAIGKRPIVLSRDGEDLIAIRTMGYLCLSFDHRVVDGAMAGRFLQALRHTLEGFQPGQGIWADTNEVLGSRF